MKEFYLTADDHNSFYCRIWEPEGVPVGIVQIIHGVSEYIGRYDAFASFLTSKGFLVTAEDHPGHGKTVAGQQKLGYLYGGWMQVVRNIHQLRTTVQEQYPHCPYFMLGHSMGSFLLRTYLTQNYEPIQGALISGTGWVPAPLVTIGRAVCKLEAKRVGPENSSSVVQTLIFGNYNRKFSPNRTPYDWICSKESVVDTYAADPLCTAPVSVQLCGEMMYGLQYIEDASHLAHMDFSMPVLFFSGTLDPVGDMGKGVQKAVRAFRQAGMQDVTCTMYSGMRHETLNETNCDRVHYDIYQWLSDHIG